MKLRQLAVILLVVAFSGVFFACKGSTTEKTQMDEKEYLEAVIMKYNVQMQNLGPQCEQMKKQCADVPRQCDEAQKKLKAEEPKIKKYIERLQELQPQAPTPAPAAPGK
jgi:peptidoglycan hydrolase CwlO-like protein